MESNDDLRIPTLPDHPPERGLTLELSPMAYRAAWFFIMVFHAFCGAFLICVAMTYWFLTDGIMSFYTSIWSLKGTQYYHFYGFVFGLVGGMHGVQILYVLFLSIRSRKLIFRSESRSLLSVPTQLLSTRSTRSRRSTPFLAFITSAFATFFSRRGFFGVENEHFSTVFALRDVLEAGSQTYQAYRASNLLPLAGLNSWIVGLLIFNCWSTAAIQYFLRKSTALARVLTLVDDALISFGIMIVVPLIIFVPYIGGFDIKMKFFKDPQFLYDPVVVANLVLENRLIFASGLFDFGTKIIPQLSILLSLVTVSELFGRAETKVVPAKKSTELVSDRAQAWDAKDDTDAKTGVSDSHPIDNTTSRGCLGALYKRRHGIIFVLFASWGTVILILHCLADHRAAHYEIQGCRAITRPWFYNGKEPCSSLVLNCYDRNIDTPDEAVFDKLDLYTLSTLAITHCPALRMPTSLQRLSSLLMLHLYNTTIVAWDTESAVTETAQPRLLSVLVGKTQMADFPPGLLEPLPAALLSVQFSETNLSKIPDDLYKRWHSMAVVSFEDGILTEIPYQMFFMGLYTLSFKGNRIETIQTLSMMPPGMIIPELRLKDNPLTELPETLTAPDAFIMSLNLENTDIATMPSWVKTNTKVVWGYDTPFCETAVTDPQLAARVVCVTRPTLQESYFPMALFDQLYMIS